MQITTTFDIGLGITGAELEAFDRDSDTEFTLFNYDLRSLERRSR